MHAVDRMQNSKRYHEGFFSQIQCGRGAEAAMRSSRNASNDALSIAKKHIELDSFVFGRSLCSVALRLVA